MLNSLSMPNFKSPKFSSHKVFFLKTASTCLSSMYGVKQKASYNITLGKKIGFFLVIPPTCYFFIWLLLPLKQSICFQKSSFHCFQAFDLPIFDMIHCCLLQFSLCWDWSYSHSSLHFGDNRFFAWYICSHYSHFPLEKIEISFLISRYLIDERKLLPMTNLSYYHNNDTSCRK